PPAVGPYPAVCSAVLRCSRPLGRRVRRGHRLRDEGDEMTDFLNDWGLILITFVPLAGALVMMAVPKQSEETHKLIALVASGIALVLGILLLVEFDTGEGLQFVVDHEWIPLINSSFILGLDGIS